MGAQRRVILPGEVGWRDFTEGNIRDVALKNELEEKNEFQEDREEVVF